MATHWNRVSGELTHTDVWRPARVVLTKGYRYYISFINDAIRHVQISFMQHKSDAPTKVKQYLSYIEHQHGLQPKAIRANNGQEYINRDLTTWCLDKGIEIQMTAPYSPEQNGTVERWNHTVVKLGHAMLF